MGSTHERPLASRSPPGANDVQASPRQRLSHGLLLLALTPCVAVSFCATPTPPSRHKRRTTGTPGRSLQFF
jgi:hypothetical protein